MDLLQTVHVCVLRAVTREPQTQAHASLKIKLEPFQIPLFLTNHTSSPAASSNYTPLFNISHILVGESGMPMGVWFSLSEDVDHLLLKSMLLAGDTGVVGVAGASELMLVIVVLLQSEDRGHTITNTVSGCGSHVIAATAISYTNT